MSLSVASISSGSNGNCYYVGTREEAVLIDCGISCREVEKRMKRLQLPITKVKAIFVSHEHGDHVCAVQKVSTKHRIPVYITRKTFAGSGLVIPEELLRFFAPDETLELGNLRIESFTKFHDAIEPVSFSIHHFTVTVGVFTDLGFPCKRVIEKLSQCHAVFLESNYDDSMLDSGHYPYALKERIRGNRGHLSNAQAFQLMMEHRPAFMSHLFLAHLSRNNNRPELVEELFKPLSSEMEVIVTSRKTESALYHIEAGMIPRKRLAVKPKVLQLGLFDL